ncbi:hypothetical protein JB92DRAFT_2191527 [Gautieria morchelliformis]|nr:hypothetical protein JB92DRAFT_2191527 [Gautieria morchelliformis]
MEFTAGLVNLLAPEYNFLRSAFEKFNRNEFMTIPEGANLILSTAVDMECDFPARTRRFGTEHLIGRSVRCYKWRMPRITEARRRLASWCGKCECADGLLFIMDATLCDMGRALLAAHSTVQKVSYVLQEKHIISVDMGLLGLQTRLKQNSNVRTNR